MKDAKNLVLNLELTFNETLYLLDTLSQSTPVYNVDTLRKKNIQDRILNLHKIMNEPGREVTGKCADNPTVKDVG